MTKRKFLAKLSRQLYGLSRADRQRSLDYYAEMIDDRMEEGMSEEEAVAEIGTPSEAASQIFGEMQTEPRQKAGASRSLRVWEIVLLVLGSPLWLSLLIALFAVIIAVLAVVLTVYAVIWAAVIALWAAELSIAVGGAAGVIASLVLLILGRPGAAFFLLGCGLVLAALAIALFFGFLLVTKLLCRFSKFLISGVVIHTKNKEVSP